MSDISISVVIPAYNRAQVIGRAIDSVLAQTLQVHDIIIVDDCSSDNTVELIQAMIEQQPETGPQIRLEQNPENKGAPFSRNRGAALATGSHIAFLDSDDKWQKDKLEKQRQFMANHDTCAVFTNFVFIRGEQRQLGKVQQRVTLADLFGRNLLGGTSSVLVKKSAFNDVGGFTAHLPSCQDWDLWLRLAQLTDLYCIDEPLVEYHIDGGSRISTNAAKAIDGHQHIFDMVETLMQGKDIDRKKVFAAQQLRMAEIYVKNLGQKKQCIKAMTKSLSNSLEPAILWGNAKLVYFLLLK